MGIRREGRELAMMILYREAVTGLTDAVIPDLDEAPPEAVAFAESLVAGVRTHVSVIDEAISGASEHWDIGRMGTVDRTVLRIGTYEIMFAPDTPVGVIIDEAIEAARKYSSDECGRFVNGILDRIARDTRGARDGQTGAEDHCDTQS
ncbi:MAG: transcription antitermination factor NusB [Candidatus Eisenbacteria bacterium]|nr:transcription antitermination factor NusB [Candidatus Eisenbacteria bacterium]